MHVAGIQCTDREIGSNVVVGNVKGMLRPWQDPDVKNKARARAACTPKE